MFRRLVCASLPAAVVKAPVVTLPIQGALAGVFYLIEAGIAALGAGAVSRLVWNPSMLRAPVDCWRLGSLRPRRIHAAEARDTRVTPEAVLAETLCSRAAVSDMSSSFVLAARRRARPEKRGMS